jgi:hypothetical protein
MLPKDKIAELLAALMPQPEAAHKADLSRLAAPFPVDAVSWRLGPTNTEKTSGIALAYIDARDVMDRLDAVMGSDWQDRYEAMPDGSYCCSIGLKIDGEWRWRSDGALMLSDSDKIDAKEMAQKGSYSDAFKRAAVKWGIGRYLYNLDSPWVPIQKRGNSYLIADEGKAKLRAVLERQAKSVAPKSGAQPSPTPIAKPEAPKAAKPTPQEKAASQATPIDEIPHAHPNPAQQAASEAQTVTTAARQQGAATAEVAKMAASAAAPKPANWKDRERAKMGARIDPTNSATLRNAVLSDLAEVGTLDELSDWAARRQQDNTRAKLIPGDAVSVDTAYTNKRKLLEMANKGLPVKAEASTFDPDTGELVE